MVRTRSQDKALDNKENVPTKTTRKLASPKKKKPVRAIKLERSEVKNRTDEVAEFRSFMRTCINEQADFGSKLRESLASDRCPKGPVLLQLRGCIVDIRHQLEHACKSIDLAYYFAGDGKQSAPLFMEKLLKTTKKLRNDKENDDDMVVDGRLPFSCLIHVVRNTSKKFFLSLLELLLDEEFPAVVVLYCNESNSSQLPPGLSYRLESKSLSFEDVLPTFNNILLRLIRHYGTEKRLMFAPNVLNFVCRQFLYHQLSFISVENVIGRVIAEFQENELKFRNAIVKLDSDFDFTGFWDALIVFVCFTKETEQLKNSLVPIDPYAYVDCYIQLQNEKLWSKKMESAKKKWENAKKSTWLEFFKTLEDDQEISDKSKAILSPLQKEVEQTEVEDRSEQIQKAITTKVGKRNPLKNSRKWTKGIIEKLEQFIVERLRIKFDFDAYIPRLLELSVNLVGEDEEVDEEIRQYIEQGAVV
ncbi:hypothetical protein M3Y95_00563300 [Aphelenchoides besseyi]|nr:hypothetical protein M3Y95_00563300 [Aphelenchoides besseyi]